MGVAAKLFLLLVAGVAARAGHAPSTSLEETRAGVTVDWGEGTLTAQGGAAGDLRMPSADLARPGAERRARAAALAKLKQALTDLPLGDGRKLSPEAVELALGRARAADVEYQSNGGAVLRMRVRFGDWLPAEPVAGPVLAADELHLAAAPALRVGGKDVVSGAARYRLGAPPAGSRPVAVKVDRQGRWAAKGDKKGDKADKDLEEKLAGAAIVIYVQKVLR